MRSVTTPANNPLRDAGPKAFRATLEASALPYGYTLTIWSSGTLLAHVRGGPSVLEIFLFVAGGVGAFIVLSAAARAARGDIASLHPCRGAWLLAGSLAWIGAGGAVGAVALVAEIPSGVAWPLGSFVATGVFLVGASGQLVVAARATKRSGAGASGRSGRGTQGDDI